MLKIISFAIFVMTLQILVITMLMPISPLILVTIWMIIYNVSNFLILNKLKYNPYDSGAPYNFTFIATKSAKKYGIVQYCIFYLIAGWLLHQYTNWQNSWDVLVDILLYLCLPAYIESMWKIRQASKHPELFQQESENN